MARTHRQNSVSTSHVIGNITTLDAFADMDAYAQQHIPRTTQPEGYITAMQFAARYNISESQARLRLKDMVKQGIAESVLFNKGGHITAAYRIKKPRTKNR